MDKANVIELHNVSIYHMPPDRNKPGRGRNRLVGCELVLSDVNAEIGRGEFVYLIGKVGSGKSTFLKTLYGEVPLLEGEGYVAGYDLRKLRSKDIPFLRRKPALRYEGNRLEERDGHPPTHRGGHINGRAAQQRVQNAVPVVGR